MKKCLPIFLCLAGFLPVMALMPSRITDIQDAEGKLDAYALQVNVEEPADGKVKKVSGTLYWNLAGRYKRFDPDPDQPLTKRNGVPFTDEDYQLLDGILRNRNSILGHHSLAWLGRPDGSDPAPDGVSGATPKTLQRTVVKDAAWTTWVLWQSANAVMPEKIRERSAKRATPGFLDQLLASQEASENAFALELLIQKHPSGARFMRAVLATLERGDNELIRLSIRYLDMAIEDREGLAYGLADSCSRMNPGYVPMTVQFLEKEPELSTRTLERLSGCLERLPYVSIRKILELLDERGCFTPAVIRNVTEIKETGSSRIGQLAQAFLESQKASGEQP